MKRITVIFTIQTQENFAEEFILPHTFDVVKTKKVGKNSSRHYPEWYVLAEGALDIGVVVEVLHYLDLAKVIALRSVV